MLFPLHDEKNYLRFPPAAALLIAVNVLVYLYSVFSGYFEEFIVAFGVIPVSIVRGEDLFTLVTSLFVHGGLLHLLSNMWFLWIFGDNVEYHFGFIKFILFYVAAGIMGTLFYVIGNLDSTIPLVGASGAISGVLGAYIVLHPRGRIASLLFLFYFIHVVRIRAVIFIGLWFLLQVLFLGDPSSPVAYAAHIGGFVAGLGMVIVLGGKNRPEYI